MAFHNMLCICSVLIAALATGDCFFSSLMNEPLNFAVSLLDGRARDEPSYHTTEWPIHTPGSVTVTGNAGTSLTAMPGRHSKYKDIVAKKLTTYIGGASKKSKLQNVQAIRHSSGSSSKQSPSSDESSSHINWKHVRPASKRPSKKAYNNQRIKASISTGRRHRHGLINAGPALSKAGHKLRQSGWRKSSWGANRSSGSGEKYPVVTAKQAKGVGSSSSSSEENVIIVKKTAKANKLRGSSKKYPVVTAKHTQKTVGSSSSEENVIIVKKTAKVNKLGGSTKKSGWTKSSWVPNRSSGSGEKYPVVTAKQAKGVGSSSSSSEENVIIVKKTAKPVNKLGGSIKKSGWTKSSWVPNRSSGSGEKYPVVTAKQAKGVGSSSSSSEENVIIVRKTAKPAHSYRASKNRQSHRGHSNRPAGGLNSKRRFSPKIRGAGLCDVCRGSY